jgi:hypothetical protein
LLFLGLPAGFVGDALQLDLEVMSMANLMTLQGLPAVSKIGL